MARTVRDHRLETRAARLRLPIRSEPYWRQISEGCHLGYYRGARGGKWVARFRPAGRAGGYDKRTLGEADDYSDADGVRILDYRHAQDAARAWFAVHGNAGRKFGPYTVSDCLDDYLEGFGGKSLYSTRARIEALIRPALGQIIMAELTRKQVEDWHKSRAAAPAMLRTGKFATERNLRPAETDEAKRRRKSTANRDLAVLKAALNAAFRDDKVRTDEAWRRVRPFKHVERARLRYLSEEEARRLVNAADVAVRPLIQAALLTGARYGELTSLRTSAVDIKAGTLWFAETKAGKPRVCYLEEEGLNLFRQHTADRAPDDFVFVRADGMPWRASQQARPLRTACMRASIDPAVGFHDLRRTFGARMAIKGVPMAVIANAMGHADERITSTHYAHLAPSYVEKTVREAVGGLGIVPHSNVTPFRTTA
jgi:integrase